MSNNDLEYENKLYSRIIFNKMFVEKRESVILNLHQFKLKNNKFVILIIHILISDLY